MTRLNGPPRRSTVRPKMRPKRVRPKRAALAMVVFYSEGKVVGGDPETHQPSPAPPRRVGEAGLAGVGGRLHGNPCIMAAYRCHTAHPGPA